MRGRFFSDHHFKRAGGTFAITSLLKSSDEKFPTHHLGPPLILSRCKESEAEGEGDARIPMCLKDTVFTEIFKKRLS
jgi:hypothetical protein